ncbi:unnamed protein product [Lactuca saligna]|uniref:GRF-type domain-containing protein n=1 Tax=Lactuca saligna TaxID=75948 RepID=A0AA35ZAQ7_LACSI|nr:unnamed protein product [Lactuca saligna]
MKTTSTISFPIFNISLSALEPLRSDSSSSSMAYLAGSSFVNDTVVATRDRDNNLCNCRHPPKVTVERMLMSNKNPTRRFRNCVDSLVEMEAKKCKYFNWIDDTNYTDRLEVRVALLENLNVEITTAKDIVDGEFAMTVEDDKQLSGELKFVRTKFGIAMMVLVLLVGVLLMQKSNVLGYGWYYDGGVFWWFRCSPFL